jgi:hypothetical protein
MPVVRALLPSALICIEDSEREAYKAAGVPDDKLLLHPKLDPPGLPQVINWMQDTVKQPVLIEIDDDFVGVQVNTGSRRFITEPDEILAILENSARACHDLGLTTFCYSRTPNTTIIRPEERPIVPTQAVCAAFGIMGAARHRRYDTALFGRADVDWALRTLLEDRLVYADIRFYFDTGPAFAGSGGNVGVVQPEQFAIASRALTHKWGNSVSFKAPAWVKKRQVSPIRIAVSRTNKTAQR